MRQHTRQYAYSRVHKFFVYAILDTRFQGTYQYGHWKFSALPIYIGKGSGKRDKTTLMRNRHNKFKSRKIANIRKVGLEPVVVFKKSNLTEKQSLQLETRLIHIIGRANKGCGPLTNLTDGGEGTVGKITSAKTKAKQSISIRKAMTQEICDRISNSMLGNTRGLGVACSDAKKKKISEAQIGKVIPRHVVEAARKANLGRKHTAETKAKMSEAQRNRAPISAETRAKLSAWQKGIPKSKAHRQAMSAAAKRKPPMTDATKAKVIAALTGRPVSKATRAKMRAAKLGKKCSPETRAKMSKAKLAL